MAWIERTEGGALYRTKLLRAGWDTSDVDFAKPPANLAESAAGGPFTWIRGATTYTVRALTLGTYFGCATPWGHVFAVMHALGERFGSDAVRLVAAFD